MKKVLSLMFAALLGSQMLLAQTDLGMNYSAEEVAVWRQRMTKSNDVNYHTTGGEGLYSPGDFERIKGYADAFLANPSGSVWLGSATQGTNYPKYEGINLQAACFMYLLHKDINTTEAAKYAAPARTSLMQQVGIAAADISKWNPATVGENGANESRWVTRILIAYDYLKDYLSAADKTTLNAWFLAQANFMAADIMASRVGQCFPQRLTGNYSIVGCDAKPNGENYGKWSTDSEWGDGFLYTHRKADGSLGNRVAYLARNWNNRRSEKANMVGMVGIFLNNTLLITHGKCYAQEWLRYSVYPDGTMAEYERNGDYSVMQQGMSYGAINMQQYIFLADALARRGDMSLYEANNSIGMHGTEGGPKSLKTVLDRYAKNMQNVEPLYHVIVATTHRIDSYAENNNIQYTWDLLLSMANKYYNSEYYKSLYTRTAPNVDPFPGDGVGISSASAVWYPWGGTGAEMPGILFMYGQMENLVKPYTTAAVCEAPTGLYLPSVYARTTNFIWNHAMGALRYNLRFRPEGTTTWTTVNGIIPKTFYTDQLIPGTGYEWQVQSVGSACTSTWTSSTFFTSPAGCTANGTIKRELWTNVTAPKISDIPITRSADQVTTLTSFEIPVNGTQTYTGTRVAGYVCAPTTGVYTFWVAGDDQAEVWVSTSDDPAKKIRAAFTSTWTNSREWAKSTTQKSATFNFIAGQKYYVELLTKQYWGSECAAVGWTLPNGTLERPIPASRISPFVANQIPNVAITSPVTNSTLAEGSNIILTATASDVDGTILRVEFYQGATKIGESTKAPFTYSYQQVPAGTYGFTAKAVDSHGATKTTPTTTVVVSGTVPAPSICATGTISQEVWTTAVGNKIADIPVTRTPNVTAALPSFEAPTNVGESYGQRLRGYVCPPTTGGYTFWISGDDQADLYLSTDANPVNKKRIAFVNWWSGVRQWDREITQQSVVIQLVAGQKYYIEALHKENAANDNLAVGWQLPNGVQERPITGTRLAPFVISGGARIGSDEPVAAAAQKLEFTAYPNPAGETLTLQANTTAGQAWTVAIYNQVGQMVGQPKQYDTVQNQISLNLNQSGITPGVYIVRVKDGNNQLHTVKFIKSR